MAATRPDRSRAHRTDCSARFSRRPSRRRESRRAHESRDGHTRSKSARSGRRDRTAHVSSARSRRDKSRASRALRSAARRSGDCQRWLPASSRLAGFQPPADFLNARDQFGINRRGRQLASAAARDHDQRSSRWNRLSKHQTKTFTDATLHTISHDRIANSPRDRNAEPGAIDTFDALASALLRTRDS